MGLLRGTELESLEECLHVSPVMDSPVLGSGPNSFIREKSMNVAQRGTDIGETVLV